MESIDKEETQKRCYICEKYKYKATWKGEKLFTRSDNIVKCRISVDNCGPIFMHHLCINKWNDYWSNFFKHGLFTYTGKPVCPQCLATKKRGWNWILLGIMTFILLFHVIGVKMCSYKCSNPCSQFELRWMVDVWANYVNCKCMWWDDFIRVTGYNDPWRCPGSLR